VAVPLRSGHAGPVELRAFGPDDLDAVQAFVDIDNARHVDAPWMHPATVYRRQMYMRYGWDGDPAPHYLAHAGGAPVGYLVVHMSSWDNLELAWLEPVIHPGHRRRGLGTALMKAAEELCRDIRRPLLGADGWDSESTRAFAASVGLERKSQSVNRRQHLAELPPSRIDEVYAEAQAHAGDYLVERVAAPSPDGLFEELSEVAASINDAPLDDLELEDDDYSPAHMRAFERAQLAGDVRLYRVLARHRETGAIAGHTVVTVPADTPEHGEQDDTTVAREHRGHRLGLLLKADMVRWLVGPAGVEPQLRTIDTWNAESNDHMVGVNERLGYRVMGRQLEFQKRI
jgi:GNAT superfamily N-acetyltransferase